MSEMADELREIIRQAPVIDLVVLQYEARRHGDKLVLDAVMEEIKSRRVSRNLQEKGRSLRTGLERRNP